MTSLGSAHSSGSLYCYVFEVPFFTGFYWGCREFTVLIKIYEGPTEMPHMVLIGRVLLSRESSLLQTHTAGIYYGIRTVHVSDQPRSLSGFKLLAKLFFRIRNEGPLANSCCTICVSNCEQPGHRVDE